MIISILVSDAVVVVDCVPVHLPGLDWSKFDGDPGTVIDDIAAVWFDTEAGQGHVEYKTVQTKPATRPNIKQANWNITQADFDRDHAWVLPHYEAGAERLRQERAAEEAKEQDRLAEVQRLADERAAARAAGAQTEDAAPAPDTKDAEIAALKAQLAELDSKVRAVTDAALETAGESGQ